MKDIILNILEKSLRVKRSFIENNINTIIKAADEIATCVSDGRKIHSVEGW